MKHREYVEKAIMEMILSTTTVGPRGLPGGAAVSGSAVAALPVEGVGDVNDVIPAYALRPEDLEPAMSVTEGAEETRAKLYSLDSRAIVMIDERTHEVPVLYRPSNPEGVRESIRRLLGSGTVS